MPLKQVTQEDLQYANINPGPWLLGQDIEDKVYRQVIANASGERVIAVTTHHRDNHPDLSAQGGELTLAATSPELLVSLVNTMACLAPAEPDFHEVEKKAFYEAANVIKNIGAEPFLTAPMSQITQEDLMSIDVKQGPWFVATGCSWRRILTETFDDQVLLPSFPDKGRQKMECRDQELRLIIASPELLVSLINLISVWMPYATDFNEEEQVVFDKAVAAIKKAGAMRLLDAVLAED